ncbi:ubiquinone anaerobic biosynthesis accessory factor UbiT [Candidatus Symbiobacter mobilis]|uniref:Ubiquinone biosynthesis accessory factor UbiT n=1 Tax=Candidatus Symbiobacter mobilis CR TaxID=946483 RepID=U5N7Y7_9BURK|nr:SCP2 sterol-binding domain-containing protein [Candidatus Symbiobacter mobilis]AGX86314.1 lipid carrier-like protein [Candidatus Symbiobacter mobilis CR]
MFPSPSFLRLPDFLIPTPLGKILGVFPTYPGTLFLVTALNTVLARHLPRDVTQALQGRPLRIGVDDARWVFDFQWLDHRFVPCPAGGKVDLTIRASLGHFLQLALRQEDPDTLFFRRHLSMEGDTELGLLVKNTLDALDLPLWRPQWSPRHCMPCEAKHPH